MTNDKPTDYAAIIRAANEAISNPPDWLKLGKRISAPNYGIGEVIFLLGKRLIVKFPGYSIPVQFKDWSLSLQANEISPEPTTQATSEILLNQPSQSLTGINIAQIKRIPLSSFRVLATQLAESLTAVDITPASVGELYPYPGDLPAQLRSALAQIGINNLYSHQLEALTNLRAGFDLSICTQTASGKTLCYNLAVLESCLQQPETTGLYIFPLKALAVDQMGKLSSLVAALGTEPALKVGLMTGDTPKDERQRLFLPAPPNILAVSPDLLHHYLYNRPLA